MKVSIYTSRPSTTTGMLMLAVLGVSAFLGPAKSLAAQEPDPSDVKTSLVPLGEVPAARGLQPPDGQWLVDDDGREYFLDKYPKTEGSYRWVDEEKGIVRLRHLMPLEVYSHDDEFFYFKVLRPQATSLAKPIDLGTQFPLEVTMKEKDTLTLSRSDEGLPRRGQWRNGFVFADMNEDGHLDLVHGPARKSFTGPRIFLGDGSGSSWKSWGEASYPSAPYDYGDVAVADFNGDGHLDMTLAMHLTGFVTLIGDGKGKFELWGEGLPLVKSVERTTAQGQPKRNPKRTPPRFSSRTMVSTDWTGNGRPDLIAVGEGPGSPEQIAEGRLASTGRVVFENLGDGTWKEHADSETFMGDHLVLTDFDGNGTTDFVTDSLVVGNHGLVNYRDEGSAMWRTEQFPVERRRPILRGVAVDDFDGDGAQDLVMSLRVVQAKTIVQAIDLYLSRKQDDGTQSWEHRILVSNIEEIVNFKSLAAGDIDGDGDADLIALMAEGNVWILLNDGKGNFVREVSPELEVPAAHKFCNGYRVRLVDLDGDGRPEIAANFAGEPGSEALFVGVAEPRCQANGSLRIWKVAAKGD